MFENFKKKLTDASKETIKEEVKYHLPEIFAGTTIILLAYLCIKVNAKPVNVTVNFTGGHRYAVY